MNILKYMIFFSLGALSLTQCAKKKSSSVIYIYFDITEGLSQNVKEEYLTTTPEIYKIMDISPKDLNGGTGYGSIKLSLLNYEYFEKPIALNLLERNERINNPRLCGDIVRDFTDSLNYSINKLFEKKVTQLDTTSSIIIKHIVEGANEILEYPYENKIMIIFSDMLEHNPKQGISFINQNIRKKDYQKIIDRISSIYNINIPSQDEFSKIKFYIIRPDHEKYPEQRLRAEAFWKHILGANCKFQSSLNVR
ncbi:MAG: hypothetical protein AAGA77_19390 [Bacteroidota bacterium]